MRDYSVRVAGLLHAVGSCGSKADGFYSYRRRVWDSAWIGYTLATTPPPKPIEEIEKELEEELKKLEEEVKEEPGEKEAGEGKEGKKE